MAPAFMLEYILTRISRGASAFVLKYILTRISHMVSVFLLEYILTRMPHMAQTFMPEYILNRIFHVASATDTVTNTIKLRTTDKHIQQRKCNNTVYAPHIISDGSMYLSHGSVNLIYIDGQGFK